VTADGGGKMVESMDTQRR